jgi:hypothetical protein
LATLTLLVLRPRVLGDLDKANRKPRDRPGRAAGHRFCALHHWYANDIGVDLSVRHGDNRRLRSPDHLDLATTPTDNSSSRCRVPPDLRQRRFRTPLPPTSRRPGSVLLLALTRASIWVRSSRSCSVKISCDPYLVAVRCSACPGCIGRVFGFGSTPGSGTFIHTARSRSGAAQGITDDVDNLGLRSNLTGSIRFFRSFAPKQQRSSG